MLGIALVVGGIVITFMGVANLVIAMALFRLNKIGEGLGMIIPCVVGLLGGLFIFCAGLHYAPPTPCEIISIDGVDYIQVDCKQAQEVE